MFENMLPIGSIVLLKGGIKKAMIIGFKQMGTKRPNIIYDYVGVMYPVGSLGASTHILFDHNDISDIIFKGYTNPEWDEMIAVLEKEFREHPEFTEKLNHDIE